MTRISTDVTIIGAGPAGTVAAAVLNKRGLSVTILEQTRFPRFVIGESLLPRCMESLAKGDLLDAIGEMDFQQKFGAKFLRGDETCDFNFSEQYTEGYNWTWQVTRADFDKKLADTVASRGVGIHYETSVTAVAIAGETVATTAVHNGEELTVHSRYIVDASGYGRVLPKLFDLDVPSAFPPRAGFFCHVTDHNRPEFEGSRIHILVISQKVWMWVIPFSNGNASVGVVGDLDFLDDALSDEEKYRKVLELHPSLISRFANAELIFEPRKLSGYACAVKKYYGDRFVLVGNSTEFLDPIFSSGVTLATESGSLAAAMIADQLEGKTVDWEEYTAHMKLGTDAFRAYVENWYNGIFPQIIFAKNVDTAVKNRICSVLAGYVWDKTNAYVTKPARALPTLAAAIAALE
ncbi:MAG: NAD(P)/FAD-dependent oxidoreductase [Bacteroidota bacterium]